ncbi:MAG: tetratricopeptide repeat protein [Candidatus Geothermincolia bacterium]
MKGNNSLILLVLVLVTMGILDIVLVKYVTKRRPLTKRQILGAFVLQAFGGASLIVYYIAENGVFIILSLIGFAAGLGILVERFWNSYVLASAEKDNIITAGRSQVEIDRAVMSANCIRRFTDYRERGVKKERSIKLLQKALRFDPTNGEAHFHLAEIYLESGRYDEAKAAIDQAVLLYPDRSDFYTLNKAIQNTRQSPP